MGMGILFLGSEYEVVDGDYLCGYDAYFHST